jgi:hypothetical protein
VKSITDFLLSFVICFYAENMQMIPAKTTEPKPAGLKSGAPACTALFITRVNI